MEHLRRLLKAQPDCTLCQPSLSCRNCLLHAKQCLYEATPLRVPAAGTAWTIALMLQVACNSNDQPCIDRHAELLQIMVLF